MKKNKNLKTPFFAHFLENQLSSEDENQVQGGTTTSRTADVITTDPTADLVQTLKYPSDQEDSYTKKYPSDNDEAHTLKYPSDGDDDLPTI